MSAMWLSGENSRQIFSQMLTWQKCHEYLWGRLGSRPKLQGLFHFELVETEWEGVEFDSNIFLLHNIASIYRVKTIFIFFFLCLQLSSN
jgi:hypothetical protein